MPSTFVEKALARAAGLPSVTAGQIVDVTPDVALSHDNTAAIARIFRGLGRKSVKSPGQLAITLDHAVPAPTTQHAANHAEVRQFVAEQGITRFYEAGRGICHQVLSEEAVILPGQTILGSDSHTTHFGWLGAFGAGIGRSEMAAIWATGQLWLRVPETIRIELEGRLPAGVTSKDLSLTILHLLGDEAGIYQAVEFGGAGLETLSVESRMVLPNLMAEAGAKCAYLEPDSRIFHWLGTRLAAQTGASIEDCVAGIASGALYPDQGAAYSAHLLLDLGAIETVVARPHAPGNVAPLSTVMGTRVQQAFLGTCTNGRLEDLAAAAAVLRRPDGSVRRVAPGTRFLVIPASSEVLAEAIAAGYIAAFVEAGAMIGTPGCGPCMGNHMGIPAPGDVTISTGNRNFRGRMGTADSDVYLASPAVVAASAVLGRIGSPAELDEVVPARPAAGSPTKIAALPRLQTDTPTSERPTALHPNPKTFSGRTWKYGDNVNTDVIFPGKYTYTLKEPEEWAKHAMEDLDPDFAATVRAGDIIVAGRNWGCGSSREQAVGCLKAAGVRVIVAASFARIYFRNAVNNGLLPVACPAAAAAIQAGETIIVDTDNSLIHCAAGTFSFPSLSPSLKAIVDAGGLVPMLKLEMHG